MAEGTSILINMAIIIAVGIFVITRFLSIKLPKDENKKDKSARILDFPQPEAEAKTPAIKSKKRDIKNMEHLAPVEKLKTADSRFKESEFIDGAKSAYNMYYEAFSSADDETLENMLSPEMFDDVANVLDADDEKKVRQKVDVERIEDALIVDARILGKTAIVDVKYTAHQAEYTIDAEENVKQGDAATFKPVTSIWTWARAVNSDDPNWELEAINALS